MQEQERRNEMRAVPQPEEPMARSSVTPMMSSANVPAFFGRISWLSSVIVGSFVALASLLVISSVIALIGYGTASVSTIAALSQVSTTVGYFIAIGGLVSLFIGGYFAARLANSL